MSEPSFGVQSMSPIIPAKDMKRSITFYEQVGFTCRPYEDGSAYAFLTLAGLDIHLTYAEHFTYNPGGLYIYVDAPKDVDAFYERLIARSLKPINKPEDREWRCREFAISDPDQLLIRIGSRLDPTTPS